MSSICLQRHQPTRWASVMLRILRRVSSFAWFQLLHWSAHDESTLVRFPPSRNSARSQIPLGNSAHSCAAFVQGALRSHREWRTMKTFVARCTFTDRREGPGTGRTLEVQATTAPGAVGKAVREFWKSLNRKQRWDALHSGLILRISERKNTNES